MRCAYFSILSNPAVAIIVAPLGMPEAQQASSVGNPCGASGEPPRHGSPGADGQQCCIGMAWAQATAGTPPTTMVANRNERLRRRRSMESDRDATLRDLNRLLTVLILGWKRSIY